MKSWWRVVALSVIMLSAAPAGFAGGLSNFGWGIDAGTSIDVSGHDMSTINFDAYFGYKDRYIDIAGFGAGIHMMVSNSCRYFPLYGVIRTGFSSKNSLCFLDFRAGVAIDNLNDGSTQTVPYINPAVGFNLATGAKFKSYLIVGYIYNGMKSFGDTSIAGGLSMINFRIGVSF